MPIDLTVAGEASRYPEHGPRLLPWLAIWLICCGIGAAGALLLWPESAPAAGPKFWFCAVGVPNLVFAIVLGIDRAGFEALWIRAACRNQLRSRWLADKVAQAQRPLQVLGIGYSLPLGGDDLNAVMEAARPLVRAQAPRRGSGVIPHNRFDEDAVTLLPAPDEDAFGIPADESEDSHVDKTEAVATITLKIVEALGPLCASVHALSQYGPEYAPAVRVLATPDVAAARVLQVGEAMRRSGLPELECLAEPAAHGFMVIDGWLDAGEHRPLLIIATVWHDSEPPEGSAEGCVAVLLNPGAYQLPEPVRVGGLLHRPVAGKTDALDALLKLALIWGGTESAAVRRAWITGVGGQQAIALLSAWKAAALEHLTDNDGKLRPDRIVGDAGFLNPWLSVAAAIASGKEGPQLLVDAAQAVVLHVTTSPHDDSIQ
ncbi:hypothetical protein QTN24_15055 [Cupriavidus sp. SZY C1]|uniref:hypothetical protein n=1 Tax=Cupriavidus sp. SZY C1 TaxID=3055037 RepID=UPI0028B70A57|nr:hypothetical protein [Cupriavidus sp. SZY C1]MDT6962817.1 hypothetical protein [Cupriavidus sp. SZY C1]